MISVHHDSDCVFCQNYHSKAIVENDFGFSVFDLHPVTNGHCLIIPYEHDWDYFALSLPVRRGMDELVIAAKEHLDDLYSPDGYNIGINNGSAAGQTVMHAHIHLIPRYTGDTDDPRGGIRWIFPRRASSGDG
ncbi:MAG: HIT family protein [Acidimicrobiaceae bacterium]|nr:HIT family protein [Acidimicrobiaceae bacterium]